MSAVSTTHATPSSIGRRVRAPLLCAWTLAAASSTRATPSSLLPTFVVYINLDRRPDRRDIMESQLNVTGLNYTRSAAFDARGYDRKSPRLSGALGCAKSHAVAMREAHARHGLMATNASLMANFSNAPSTHSPTTLVIEDGQPKALTPPVYLVPRSSVSSHLLLTLPSPPDFEFLPNVTAVLGRLGDALADFERTGVRWDVIMVGYRRY